MQRVKEKYSLTCTPELAERIEEFRCEMGLRTRSDAVTELIARGFVAADY